MQAEAVINGIVEREATRNLSPEELARRIEEETTEVGQDIQGDVVSYLDAVRRLCRSEAQTVVCPLSAGVGGQWDGSRISIASSTLQIGEGGVAETVSRMKEVSAHEALHARGHHELIQGPETIRIGDMELTRTAVIEGYVGWKNEDQRVSDEYKDYRANLKRALASSREITHEKLEEALNNKHDLSAIDESNPMRETMERRKAA